MVPNLALGLWGRLPRGRPDPGGGRLRSLETSPLVTEALPAGYEVLSIKSVPPRWDDNGYPISGGKPDWADIHVYMYFASAEPEDHVVAVWAERAAADGWEPKHELPLPHNWAWYKPFPGYQAYLLVSFVSDGRYEAHLSAPSKTARGPEFYRS